MRPLQIHPNTFSVPLRELSAFPGPLKPGVTHKNDVIKFCERKITASRGRADIADRESYILLWEMLILMLRQKGQVDSIPNVSWPLAFVL